MLAKRKKNLIERDYTPPTEPCNWAIYEKRHLVFICEVGPHKTAYDAWQHSGLSGAFNQYEYLKGYVGEPPMLLDK